MASTTVRVTEHTHNILRELAADRLAPRPLGTVSAAILRAVEDRLRLLLVL